MNRDKKLLKKILIEIKDKEPIDSGKLEFGEYDSETIINHLQLLAEQGLFMGIDSSTKDGISWHDMRLTSQGHDKLEELQKNNEETLPITNPTTKKNEIFIVHGHDEKLLYETARFLERIEINPIILFEMPNKGQTIIEKLESNSLVSYAIVLFTPDDVGKSKNDKNDPRPRARQNVVLELGFFIGKLGRQNVAVLYDENVELPSDYRGVGYTKIDKEGGWKIKLAKELNASGFSIDMNKVIS